MLALAFSLWFAAATPLFAGADHDFAAAAAIYARGHWELAAEEFASFVREHPQHAKASQACFYQGEALAQLGRYLAAAEAFQQFLEHDPVSPQARHAQLRLAEAHYFQGDWPAATAAFTALLTSADKTALTDNAEPPATAGDADPVNRALIAAYLGDLALKSGDPSTAIAHFSQAMRAGSEAKPDSHPLAPRFRFAYALALYRSDRWEEAAGVFGSLAKEDKLGAEASYWRGRALVSLGRHLGAAQCFAAAAEQHADHPLAPSLQLQAALAFRQADQLPAARAAWNRVIAGWPQSRWAQKAYEEQLHLAILASDAASAARLVDEVRAMWPAKPAAWPLIEAAWPLAEDQFASADFAAAADLYTRLAEAAPETAKRDTARLALAWCRFEQGQSADCIEGLKTLLADRPAPAVASEAWLLLGQAEEKRDDLPAALVAYERVAADYPNGKEAAIALVAVARVAEQSRALAKAAAALGTLIEHYQRYAEQEPRLPPRDALLYQAAWLAIELHDRPAALARFELLANEHADSRYALDAGYRVAEADFQAKRFAICEARLEKLSQRIAAAPEAKAASEPTSSTPAAATDPAVTNPTAAVPTPSLQPGNPEVYEKIGYLYALAAASQGRYDIAADRWAAWSAAFPQSSLAPAAEYWWAEAEEHLGQFAPAAARYERVAERPGVEPDLARRATIQQIQLLVRQKAYPEAQRAVETAQKRSPHLASAPELEYLAGRAAMGLADFAGARLHYRAAIEADGGAIKAKTELASQAQWLIGESYFHQQAYDSAAAEYRLVIERYPHPDWIAAAWLQIGKCQERQGRPAQAVDSYEQAVKHGAGSAYANEAAERLQVLEPAQP